MKLLQKHPDGSLTMVNHPAGVNLRGVKDALDVAQHTGDGEYIADFLDGTYVEFGIKDGQLPAGFNLADVQYGQPHHRTAEGERFTRGDSNSFPSIVPDVVGTETQDEGVAFEDYVPTAQRG